MVTPGANRVSILLQYTFRAPGKEDLDGYLTLTVERIPHLGSLLQPLRSEGETAGIADRLLPPRQYS
jgi:hypothetical protein